MKVKNMPGRKNERRKRVQQDLLERIKPGKSVPALGYTPTPKEKKYLDKLKTDVENLTHKITDDASARSIRTKKKRATK